MDMNAVLVTCSNFQVSGGLDRSERKSSSTLHVIIWPNKVHVTIKYLQLEDGDGYHYSLLLQYSIAKRLHDLWCTRILKSRAN